MLRRLLTRVLPLGKIMGLYEALTRVAREYQDIGEAQAKGGYDLYACGVWMGGIRRGHAEKVRAMLDNPDFSIRSAPTSAGGMQSRPCAARRSLP